MRYKELENKTKQDLTLQEEKFAQVQEQIYILAQSTQKAK